MASSPVKVSAPLHRRVVIELTRRIVQGEIEPGSLVPAEPRLSEEFGVSRIVIREAAKVLAEKGLVEVRRGRGTSVTPPQRWSPLDPLVLALRGRDGFYTAQAELLEARKVFEVEIAGLAATRISPEALGAISTHLRGMDGMINDPDAFHKSDADFHFLLVQAAHNAVLAKLIEPIHDILTSGFRLTARLPGVPKNAQAMHWAIFRGLEKHDPQETKRAMRAHLEQAEQDLVKIGAWIKDPAEDLL